ncbi:MAG: hypothetical protein IT436_16445 [Phycisphaerales bacterium]|nr:hypothetical protein [Phycisphaerales bacterium]
MLIPRAMWLLLYLRIKGSIRRALFSGSTRKTIATVVGGVAMGLWLMNLVFRGFTHARTSAEGIRLAGPAVLAWICLMPLAFGGASRMLAFSPAEIDQLFPAPFSRRQLVAFRIVKVSLASLFTGVFYTLIFGGASISWGLSFIAACLAWIFTGLLTMSFALIEATLAQRASLLRLLPQGLLLAALAAIVWQVFGAPRAGDPAAQARAVLEAPVIQALAIPFRPFIMLFSAQSWTREAPLWLGICLAEVLILAMVTLRLDTAWLDTSIAATHARAERLERRRQGKRPARGGLSGRLKRLVPELEFAGPARAVIRRHLHASPAILVTPVAVAAGLGAIVTICFWFMPGDAARNLVRSITITLGLALFLTLPSFSRADFRSDIDHLELLKSLPLSAAAITRAQLIIPTALLIITAWEVLAAAAVVVPNPGLLAGIAMVIPPAAILMIAIENALFLFAPVRPGPAQAAALQVTGKRIITLAAKAIVLAICAGLAFGVGYLAHLATGSWPVTGLAAALALSVEASLAIAVVTALYRGFDVAVDMPD